MEVFGSSTLAPLQFMRPIAQLINTYNDETVNKR